MSTSREHPWGPHGAAIDAAFGGKLTTRETGALLRVNVYSPDELAAAARSAGGMWALFRGVPNVGARTIRSLSEHLELDPANPRSLTSRISEAWQDLLDKDDRTSPDDYPEMCLITRDELANYMASSCGAGWDDSSSRALLAKSAMARLSKATS